MAPTGGDGGSRRSPAEPKLEEERAAKVSILSKVRAEFSGRSLAPWRRLRRRARLGGGLQRRCRTSAWISGLF
eukprot:9473971-Pyramimonas_sp.AAC.1